MFKRTTKLLWHISWRWVVPAIHRFSKLASQFGIIYCLIWSQAPFQEGWILEQTGNPGMQHTHPIGNFIRVFQKITKPLGTPSVDLLASRLCHQLPQYIAWKPDPNSFVIDAMQQDWNKMFAFTFPHFRWIVRVLNKVLGENVEAMILVTPIWQT